MDFMSPALLGGVALVAIPIALHLVMRREPRRLTFPALRFVKQRRDANRRRLQLRQLLLLALRSLLVAGLATALARPMLTAGHVRGKAGAPPAVALVVDNAPRMAYVTQGASRLQTTVAAAAPWLEKLTEASATAVIDRSRSSAGFASDSTTAQSRLKSLKIAPNPRPLTEAIVEGIQLVSTLEDHRQEVFVFSDLAVQAWPVEELAAIQEALAAAPDVQLYVVDVGDDEPQNAWLGEVELSASTLRHGEPLSVAAEVHGDLLDDAPLVELLLQDAEGNWQKREEQIVRRSANPADAASSARRVLFEIADLPLGTTQGVLRLASGDPLPFDNERFFSAIVRPPARLLLLAHDPDDALFVREALTPSALAELASGYVCDVKTFADETPLDKFDAVWLLDPDRLSDDRIQALVEYAESGGGVGLFLGHRVDSLEAWNAQAPQRLLPGPLKRRSRDETYFRPQRYDHPALSGLRNYAEEIPWALYRVYQYWEFETVGEGSYVVAPFANGQPALLERRLGRGRTLTLTTPLSDRLTPEGRDPWNILPTHPEPWPFVALCDQWAGYLSQRGRQRLNYLAGETAQIEWEGRQHAGNFALRVPNGQMVRRTAGASDAALAISSTESAGNYRLTAGGESQRMEAGFSVNFSAGESRVERASLAELRQALPEDQVQFADDLASAERFVVAGRSGRDLFGWALAVAALAWGGEHWLANRFYREAS